MTFGAAIKYCLSHPFTFSGRARRSEFWWFFLFLELVGVALSFVLMVIWLVALLPILNRVDVVTGQPSHDDAVRAGVVTITVFGVYFLLLLVLRYSDVLPRTPAAFTTSDQSAHWLWFVSRGARHRPGVDGDLRGHDWP